MKKILLDFVRRGMASMGFGPIILAVLYLILDHQDLVGDLTVGQVCIGIFSLSILAFIAGGMNCLYQIERLPLMVAILIHGSVLYAVYLITYLVNGWLDGTTIPFLVFTGIFVLGYFAIWLAIYVITQRRTRQLNKILWKKQEDRGSK